MLGLVTLLQLLDVLVRKNHIANIKRKNLQMKLIIYKGHRVEREKTIRCGNSIGKCYSKPIICVLNIIRIVKLSLIPVYNLM